MLHVDHDIDHTVTREPVRALRIEPSHGWVSLKLHELWEYRELLYFLTWRDIKVRYKQTVLGATWAIIQSFFTISYPSSLLAEPWREVWCKR